MDNPHRKMARIDRHADKISDEIHREKVAPTSPDDPWPDIIWIIKHHGCPRKSELAAALRSGYPIPPYSGIQTLVADLIEGNANFPPGRRKSVHMEKYLEIAAQRVHRLARFKKHRGKKNAYPEARAAVATEYEIPVSTLDAYIYPRKSRR